MQGTREYNKITSQELADKAILFHKLYMI